MFNGHHGPHGPATLFLVLQVLVVVGIGLLALASLRLAFFPGRATRAVAGGQPTPSGQAGIADAPPPPPAPARAILDERLAKGEIDVKDYQARLAALGEEAPGA